MENTRQHFHGSSIEVTFSLNLLKKTGQII